MELNNQFVPYEQALELKELGFNELCIAAYDEELELGIQDFEQNYNTFPKHIIAAPLWQQAFDWFRNHHKLEYCINKSNEYFYEIYNYKDNKEEGEISSMQSGWIYNSYEEACLECLKKLIEIIKEKENGNNI